jgi:hypothetical protein
MDNGNDLTIYRHTKDWLSGKKPPAQGRLWQRGKRPKRPPKPQHHLWLQPTEGVMTLPDGSVVSYVVQQLMPAEGWQARYSEADGSTFCQPLACLALAALTSGAQTGVGIFGIDYEEEGEGWKVCNTHDNFVGLVPPWEDEDEKEDGDG